MKDKTDGEKIRRGVTLCPLCYQEGKRSVLVYDRITDQIKCYSGSHNWKSEDWIAEMERRKK